MRALLLTLVVYALAAVVLTAAPAFAGQLTAFGDNSSQGPASGWSVTPSMMVSRTYDDNVLLRGPGEQTVEDFITILNPKGELVYHGVHSEFAARYDGAFLMYQRSNGLNSFDQHGGLSLRRQMSKRNTVYASANLQQSPTTELLQFIGVPYIRVGSLATDVAGGLETTVSKRFSVVTRGHYQQVHFDDNNFSALLFGGYSVGGGVGLRERISAHTTLTADYDYEHATIGTQEDVFNVQNGNVGIDHQLSEGLHVFAAGGFSRLDVGTLGTPQTAPSWRLGLSDHYRATTIDVSFSRSYVPSFGYGGTMQNQEATASIKMPVTRRIYTQGIASWRKEDALVFAAPELRSIWVQAVVGYTARSWVRIEGYYASTHQTAANTGPNIFSGALMSHDQVGIQVVAAKPVRIH
ncbi:MAG TPA: hypothetical protein VFP91_01825 [Vicinamibacterales bacterium]|nr:hypothetical protein [Vicinamibacterales bacterium]